MILAGCNSQESVLADRPINDTRHVRTRTAHRRMAVSR